MVLFLAVKKGTKPGVNHPLTGFFALFHVVRVDRDHTMHLIDNRLDLAVFAECFVKRFFDEGASTNFVLALLW